MAQVLGESGRFASQEAVRKQRARWKLLMLFMGLDGFIVGFLIRGLFPRLAITSGTGILASLVLVLLICGAGTWTFRKVEELDKERANWQTGTGGEALVARESGKLPEELKVTNDGLTHLDKDFTEKAGGNGRPRISAIVQTRGDKANPPRASLTPSHSWSGSGPGRRSRTPS